MSACCNKNAFSEAPGLWRKLPEGSGCTSCPSALLGMLFLWFYLLDVTLTTPAPASLPVDVKSLMNTECFLYSLSRIRAVQQLRILNLTFCLKCFILSQFYLSHYFDYCLVFFNIMFLGVLSFEVGFVENCNAHPCTYKSLWVSFCFKTCCIGNSARVSPTVLTSSPCSRLI